jgi:hypothetical protein
VDRRGRYPGTVSLSRGDRFPAFSQEARQT